MPTARSRKTAHRKPSPSQDETLRIATWNVNSVRLRSDGLRRLVDAFAPDVLCLQETKVQNDLFPHEVADSLGYEHRLINGQKGYHGVAILSRRPFVETGMRSWAGKSDARHAFATIADSDGAPLEIQCFYVPAGGDVPDPEANDKFAHKLAFLREMASRFAARRDARNRLVLVGDLNVAPLETDVWSHKQLLKVVSHTPVETALLAEVAASHDWVDAVRHFIPPDEKLYSWWSYRARDWSASDRGRRLDHIWVTPALAPALKHAAVLREARGWPQPSDHVPVVLDLAL